MSMNKPEIKFSDKEDKASVTYQTNEGAVTVEFKQKSKKSVDVSRGADPFDYKIKDVETNASLVAKVSIKKTGKLSKDIFTAQTPVYSGFQTSDINFTDYNQSSGSLSFFKNLEDTQFSHENADVLQLIKRAQKDVVAQIPNERSRRYDEELAKEEKELDKIDRKIERRENFVKGVKNVLQHFMGAKNQR